MGSFRRALRSFWLELADKLMTETAMKRLDEKSETETTDAIGDTSESARDRTEEIMPLSVSSPELKLMTFQQIVVPAIVKEFERRIEDAAATDSRLGALYLVFKGKSPQELISEITTLANRGKILEVAALQRQALELQARTGGLFQDAAQSALQQLDLPCDSGTGGKVKFLLQNAAPIVDALTRLGAIAISGWADPQDFDRWPPQFRWSTEEVSLTSARNSLRKRGISLDVVRFAHFSFMPHCDLLEVGRKEHRAFLLNTPSIVRALDKTNEPIYWLSDAGFLNLTEENVAEYVVFFFHLVQGHLGRFLIVSDAQDMRWIDPDAPPEDQFAQCREFIRPLCLQDAPGEDVWRLRASVQFKNALFETDVVVTRAGIMELTNEELRVEDLAVRY
jgi:hypothetical protein